MNKVGILLNCELPLTGELARLNQMLKKAGILSEPGRRIETFDPELLTFLDTGKSLYLPERESRIDELMVVYIGPKVDPRLNRIVLYEHSFIQKIIVDYSGAPYLNYTLSELSFSTAEEAYKEIEMRQMEVELYYLKMQETFKFLGRFNW